MLHVVFARLGCIVVSALISCAMSTTVLVAATVSTGLSIAVFSILTLWTTSLWFGETYEMMSAWPGFMLAFMGVLTVTNFAPVQEGYTFDLTKEGSAETMEGFLFDELCQAAGELLMNCTPQTLASSYTNITLPPDANVFAGQTAYLLTEGSPSSSTMVYIPGGLYLVRAFWSPFTNQISVYPSLLVAMAYAAICVAVGILVPPVRTYRSILTKNVIPDALQQVADNLVSEEDFESLKNNSVALMNKIATQKASTTLFEPRCCHFDLLVKELDALLESCRDLIWASVVLPTLDQESANYARKNFCFDQASKQLIEFSKALRYTDLELIHAPTHDPLPTAMTDAAAFVRARCEGIRKPTTEWILAILRPSSKLSSREKVDFVISTGRVWLLAPFLLAQRLGEALLFLFHREHWNGRLLLWGCKWTLGFVALFGLSIYFPVFRDFTLKSSSSPGKPLFLGWQLFG